jgi:hypothetical protein
MAVPTLKCDFVKTLILSSSDSIWKELQPPLTTAEYLIPVAGGLENLTTVDGKNCASDNHRWIIQVRKVVIEINPSYFKDLTHLLVLSKALAIQSTVGPRYLPVIATLSCKDQFPLIGVEGSQNVSYLPYNNQSHYIDLTVADINGKPLTGKAINLKTGILCTVDLAHLK